MTRIRFQSVCLAFLLVLQPVIALGSSISPSDSIRRQLSHLSGTAKLQALNNLCYIAGNQNDSINELNCIEAFRKEAAKQPQTASGRPSSRPPATASDRRAVTSNRTAPTPTPQASPKPAQAAGSSQDAEFDEIADILRKRGIN